MPFDPKRLIGLALIVASVFLYRRWLIGNLRGGGPRAAVAPVARRRRVCCAPEETPGNVERYTLNSEIADSHRLDKALL